MFAWLVVVPESVTARHTARKDFMRTPCPQDPCDQAILRLAWSWPTWYRWCGSLWPAMARRLSGVVRRRNSNAERLPSRQWRALRGGFPLPGAKPRTPRQNTQHLLVRGARYLTDQIP